VASVARCRNVALIPSGLQRRSVPLALGLLVKLREEHFGRFVAVRQVHPEPQVVPQPLAISFSPSPVHCAPVASDRRSSSAGFANTPNVRQFWSAFPAP